MSRPALVLGPPPLLAAPGLARLWAALPRARLVGGVVRDLLAGLAPADIDLATPDPPEMVVAALARAGIRFVPSGLDHGTLTALVDGRSFEVTSLRRDVATDGRHAVVAFGADFATDAARRDFTLNAMSMTREGAVFDAFGGVADLAAGRIRFVGEAGRRIEEDFLRALRFFRFQARFGREAADAAALAAITARVAGLARLSAERVWGEIKRILAAPDPRAAVAGMAETGVLAAVLPEATGRAAFDRLVASAAPADPLLRFSALCPAAGVLLAARLRLSREERDALAALAGPAPDPGAEDDALRRAREETPLAVLLGRAWRADDGTPAWGVLRARLATLPAPVFPLAGRDVLALGVAPGPAVGAMLHEVRRWWRAGGCRASREACLAELARSRRSQ